MVDEDGNILGPRAPASFVRYTQTIDGSTLAVPREWVEAPVGEIFKKSIKPIDSAPRWSGRLIEEVD
jgi:Ino eighty subunit 2